jgi:hypothetical protein
VKQLKVCKNDIDIDSNDDDNDEWPTIEIEWDTHNTRQKETFDAVCICNGHYNAPSSPHVQGIEQFQGQVIHSIAYDDPSVFKNQTVVCVGGRASGADLAREISQFAKKVYLSDTTCPILDDGLPLSQNNVVWVPKTVSIEASNVHFEKPCVQYASDVDVIIFCSGYDYKFPFINQKSNIDLEAVPGERRISPLFEHLWHAQYPNIAFIGLQHSVVPFPFFELQAEAFAYQLELKINHHRTECVGDMILPLYLDRMEAAIRDKNSGGPKEIGRIQDTHFLGSFQWDACRRYAKYANSLNDDTENFIATNKVICFLCILYL